VSVIDDYLKKIEPAKRKELQRVRTMAKEIVPNAEEAIVYGMPTLKFENEPFLGFDAHKEHIGIYPFSGKIVPQLGDALRDYSFSKGAIRVPFDRPISKTLLKKIIDLRLKMIRAEKEHS
jgi:uncharacterized protein YdhG (YjbR/CyaY superfamily)